MSAWELPLEGLRRILSGAQEKGDAAKRQKKPDQAKSWQPGTFHLGALGLSTGLALGPLIYQSQRKVASAIGGAPNPLLEISGLPFASISSATVAPADVSKTGDDATAVEPRTGLQFTRTLVPGKKKPCCKKPGEKDPNDQVLAGLGVRVKKIIEPAGVKVYAFGVYVDPEALREHLGPKYSGVPAESLKASKWLLDDIMASDCPVTIRLIINYKNLKIGQVRSAFNDSLGGSLRDLSGKPEPDLLHNFTKWFSEGTVLHKGTVIDLRRTPGHVVTTEFDSKPAGSVTSSLLSRALLSLYLGDKSFDSKTREEVRGTVATILTAGS